MLGSRMFYARCDDGVIYGFDRKRDRDNCGGEPVPCQMAYLEGYKNVPYWQYDKWIAEYKRYQGVKAKGTYLIKPVIWREDQYLCVPFCPYCNEPAYYEDGCCFCGKDYIWTDDKESL